MTVKNRNTGQQFDSAKPENAQRQLTRAVLTTGGTLVPVLHGRHHEQRWSKSCFHTNRKLWLDIHSRYLRGE